MLRRTGCRYSCQPHLCVVFAMNPYSSLQSRSVRAIASCAVTSRPPFFPLSPSALTTALRPANASWTGTPELTSCRSLYRTFVWLTLGESLMICLNASSIVMCLFLFGYWKTPAHRVRVNRGYVVVQSVFSVSCQVRGDRRGSRQCCRLLGREC